MNEKKEYGWKLQEIILVAMLCIVFGVVYLAGVYLASFLSTLLTPVGLAPLANELVFGVWFMASTLAAYILQKPGAAIVAEVLAALIEVLLGNMYGPMPGLGWLLHHPLFVELCPLWVRQAGRPPAGGDVPHPAGQLADFLRRPQQGHRRRAGPHRTAQGLRPGPGPCLSRCWSAGN